MGASMIELELPFPPSVNHYYERRGCVSRGRSIVRIEEAGHA